jgi:hypothetical protein
LVYLLVYKTLNKQTALGHFRQGLIIYNFSHKKQDGVLWQAMMMTDRPA